MVGITKLAVDERRVAVEAVSDEDAMVVYITCGSGHEETQQNLRFDTEVVAGPWTGSFLFLLNEEDDPRSLQVSVGWPDSSV